MKNCSKCGALLEDNAKFCTECGASCEEVQSTDSNKEARDETNIGASDSLGVGNSGKQNDSSELSSVGDESSGDTATLKQHSKLPLIIGIVAVVAVIAVIVVAIVVFFLSQQTSSETTTKVQTQTSQTQQETQAQHIESSSGSVEEEADEPSFGSANSTAQNPPQLQAGITGSYPGLEMPFDAISASSVLEASSYGTYDAANVADGDNSTAWVEGVSGNGVGSEITFSSPTYSGTIGEMALFAGYDKSEDIYYKNARPKQITIIADGEVLGTAVLEDSYSGLNVVFFGKDISPSTITVRIDSVYEGNRYEDCAISEIGFR